MLNKFMNNLAKHFASLALIVGVISTSQSCHFFLNQPEVPDEMKKLVKKRKYKEILWKRMTWWETH